jgi:hypothetical protein
MSTVTRSARVADNFALIANAALRDETLSFRARGLMAYLLSLPPNWKTSVRKLADKGTEGRDAVAAALNELVDRGYVTRSDRREGGKYKGVDYYVTDDPAIDRDAPLPEQADDDESDMPPHPGNPDTVAPRPGKPDPVLPDPVQPDPADQPLQRKRTTNTGRTKTDPRRAAAQDRGDSKRGSSPSVTREARTNRKVSAVEGTRSARPDGPGRVAFERAALEQGIVLKALAATGGVAVVTPEVGSWA